MSLLIISGPSGSGQDSVIEGLKKVMDIDRVVTTTTRAERPEEVGKLMYYFISKEEFEDGIKNGDFFEWAQAYGGHYYGVKKEEINRVINSDKIGIWRIEYHGVETAKKSIPSIKALCLHAPLDILEQRIRRRNPEYSDEFIKERMEYTKEFIKHEGIYDYVVENEENKLDETILKVKKIIEEIIEGERK